MCFLESAFLFFLLIPFLCIHMCACFDDFCFVGFPLRVDSACDPLCVMQFFSVWIDSHTQTLKLCVCIVQVLPWVRRQEEDEQKIKRWQRRNGLTSADSEWTSLRSFRSSSDRDIWYSTVLMVLISVPKTTEIGELKITYLRCLFLSFNLPGSCFVRKLRFSSISTPFSQIKIDSTFSIYITKKINTTKWSRNATHSVQIEMFNPEGIPTLFFTWFQIRLDFLLFNKTNCHNPVLTTSNILKEKKSLQQKIQLKFCEWKQKDDEMNGPKMKSPK